MSINSGDHTGSKTTSKAAMLSCSTQSKPLLFLDQLEVDVTGTIVVMIGRVSADPRGFCRYPFRLIEFDQVKPTNKKYLIDIVGYVTNVGRTSCTKTRSKTLEFYLANQRGQSLRVTLWGELDDISCLQELRADDSRAAPSKALFLINCSQPREGTLENLLIR
nr:hypothetical protein [Tanacetum cinerariifolium]